MYIESLVTAAQESGLRLCAQDKEAFFDFLQEVSENDEKLSLGKVQAIWLLVQGAWPTTGKVWAIWM